MHLLVYNIKVLKFVEARWEHDKKKALKEELLNLEGELNYLYKNIFSGILTKQVQYRFSELEGRRFHIFKVEDETWRLKSKSIWLA